MARVYKTLGDDAKTRRLTIPMSKKLLEQLTTLAAEAGRTRTDYARMLIERSLKAGMR